MIDKENLEVFATPKISVIDLVPILKLEAQVALKPNAKIGKLEDIKLEVIKDKISAKEVNNIINQSHLFNDIALLRRELISRNYLSRKDVGSKYWKSR